MTLDTLKPTLREALITLVTHAGLERRPGGYVPTDTATHAPHSMRAVKGLVREGLAVWIDDEVHARPTAAGTRLVREAFAPAHAAPLQRSRAA